MDFLEGVGEFMAREGTGFAAETMEITGEG